VPYNDTAPALSRLDPRTGEIKRYFLPFHEPPGTLPQDTAEMGRIVQSPDGDLWFTVKYISKGVYNDIEMLGQFHPQTGVFRSIILPNVPGIHTFEAENLNGAAEDENPLLLPTSTGGVWVLRTLLPSKPGSGSFLTRLDYVSSTGQVTVMSAPDHGFIEGFALAPDKTLWAVYSASYHWPFSPIVTQENRLARVSPNGVFTSFCRLPGGDITDIAIGPDSQLWVAVDDHPGVEIEKMALPQ
jgi:hypothetical protein